MDELIKQLVTSAPGTGAAIIVVLIFMRYIATRDVSHKELVADFRETAKHCANIVERNSEKLGEVSPALRETSEVNRQMLDWLKQHNGK